jgi:nucleotide-binding universal stress UspA family protein
MKTILIPTNFSKKAYYALHYATQLFKNERCRFIITHSFENQVTNLTSRVDIGKTEAVVDELYKNYKMKCDEVKHEITLENPNENHTYKCIATSLSLVRATNKLIVKENVDYVVMGSKGVTGAISVLMSSKILTMIKKIKRVPLLIVPKEMDYRPIKKIAFATGFKRPHSNKQLEPLVTVGVQQNAIVNVLHIHKKEKLEEAQRAHLDQLFKIFHSLKPQLNWLPYVTNKYTAVSSYINKDGVDLLAMVYYKHNFFTAMFREEVVKNIAEHTSTPFLILPALD